MLVYWIYNTEGGFASPKFAKEQAMEMGISVREAECRIDMELFLDEYPRWELEAPHQSVILA